MNANKVYQFSSSLKGWRSLLNSGGTMQILHFYSLTHSALQYRKRVTNIAHATFYYAPQVKRRNIWGHLWCEEEDWGSWKCQKHLIPVPDGPAVLDAEFACEYAQSRHTWCKPPSESDHSRHLQLGKFSFEAKKKSAHGCCAAPDALRHNWSQSPHSRSPHPHSRAHSLLGRLWAFNSAWEVNERLLFFRGLFLKFRWKPWSMTKWRFSTWREQQIRKTTTLA